jgi:hypothetical protein
MSNPLSPVSVSPCLSSFTCRAAARTVFFRWLCLVLALVFRGSGYGVTVEWDPNNEPDVAGYRLYYGPATGHYTTVVDAGNATSVTVPDLATGTTYHFVITAYNSADLESPASSEIAFTIPEPAGLDLRSLSVGEIPASLADVIASRDVAMQPVEGTTPESDAFSLFVAGESGATVSIDASGDLLEWKTLGTVVNSTGALAVTDVHSGDFSSRFYRVRKIVPLPGPEYTLKGAWLARRPAP